MPTVPTIVLSAQAGDVIEVALNGSYAAEAVDAFLDVHTGANYFAGAGGAASEGIVSWAGPTGVVSRVAGSFMYDVVASDITGGLVTLTLRYRTSAAAAKTLRAVADFPLQFSAKVLGPPDPN